MRGKIYLIVFLLIAGVLFYLGRDVIRRSVLVAWGLTFGVGVGTLVGAAEGCLLLWLLRRLVPAARTNQQDTT